MFFKKILLDKSDYYETEHIVSSFHSAVTNIKKKRQKFVASETVIK